MDQIPWATLGPGSLLALVVLLIIRGDLIPRKWHDEVRSMLAQRDEVIDVQGQSITTLSEQVRRLADGQETIMHIVRELPRPESDDR